MITELELSTENVETAWEICFPQIDSRSVGNARSVLPVWFAEL